jgi:hypothetical protein
MMTHHKTVIHVHALFGTIGALYFLFLQGRGADMFFTKGRAVLTPEMSAILTAYGGLVFLLVSAMFSARITKETAQGLGVGFLCRAAPVAYAALHPSLAKSNWLFVALDVLSGAYFLATANSLPASKSTEEKQPKTHHQTLQHAQAAIATVTALLCIFATGVVANLFFLKGAAALTPELTFLMLSFGGDLIMFSAAICSIRLSKETSQGVGLGFLVCAAACVYICLQPTIKPVVFLYPLIDALTGVYFLATAGALPSHAPAAKPEAVKKTH